MSVLDPQNELRFSRQNQAILFCLASGVLLAAGVTLLLVLWTVEAAGVGVEELPYPLWLLATPWLPALLIGYFAYRCIRYPYLILSQAGVEIFPFWKSVQNFRLIEWGAIDEVEFRKNDELVLHFDQNRSGGVVLSLKPIPKKGRALLMRAMNGVMEQRPQ